MSYPAKYMAELSYSERNTEMKLGNAKSDQFPKTYSMKYMTEFSSAERNIEGVLENAKSDQNF